VPLTHKEAVKRKQQDIDEIRQKMQDSKIAIFTDYRGEGKGMTVKAMTNLRRQLREVDSEYTVYKNTLFRIVMKDIGAEKHVDEFANPTAVAFGFSDPSSTSKALVDFLKDQKENPLPVIKSAYMDGKLYGPEQIKVLATLPSRDELLAHLLRTMNGPLQGFVNVLTGVPRALVTVLDRIKEEKEKQA
jgi:large subunit ribosomal protein L10